MLEKITAVKEVARGRNSSSWSIQSRSCCSSCFTPTSAQVEGVSDNSFQAFEEAHDDWLFSMGSHSVLTPWQRCGTRPSKTQGKLFFSPNDNKRHAFRTAILVSAHKALIDENGCRVKAKEQLQQDFSLWWSAF